MLSSSHTKLPAIWGYAILTLLNVAPSFAQTSFDLHLQQKKFTVAPNTCGLTRFSLVNAVDVEDSQSSHSRYIPTSAVIETSDPSCMRDYGIVQFIKGCSMESYYDPKTGKIDHNFVDVEIRGVDKLPFIVSDWEVDTIDADPLYQSYSNPDATEEKRLDWYQTPNKPLTLTSPKETLKAASDVLFSQDNQGKYFNFLMKRPQANQSFTFDIPSGSSYYFTPIKGLERFDHNSFQFMTCVYHMKDVPMTGSPASFKTPEAQGGPITCFSWSDNTRFDVKKKTFISATTIDPVCTGSIAKRALKDYQDSLNAPAPAAVDVSADPVKPTSAN